MDRSFRDHRMVSTQFDIEQPVVDTGGWRVLAPFRSAGARLLMAAVSLSIFAEGAVGGRDGAPGHRTRQRPRIAVAGRHVPGGRPGRLRVGRRAGSRPNQPARHHHRGRNRQRDRGVTIASLGLIGALQIWHMAVAAAALGIAAAFFFPAYSAILPRMLPAEQLLAANGVEGVVRPVFQRAVGPAIAGIVVGATFPSVGAVVVAVLFAIGLLLLVATRPAMKTPVHQPDQERPRLLRDLRDGFVFMVRTPWLLWTLLFASMFVLLVLGPIEVLLPFIAKQRFEDGARTFGFILAFFGVGSALGALLVSSGRLPRRYLTVMMTMWSVGSIPLVVVGVTSSFPLMAAATFIIGVTDGAGMVIWGTLLQRRVPTEMLGRVSSLDFFVSLAFMPVSFAIVGPLSKVVSMQTIFLVAGIAPVLFAAVALRAARMRQDELAHPLR